MEIIKSLKIFLKLIPYLKSVRNSIVLGIITGITFQIIAISGAAAGAYLVSLAFIGATPDRIIPGICILVMLVLLRALSSYGEMWFAHKAAYGILATLRVQLYRAIEKIAPGYLMNKRTGDLSSTLMADVETLEWFYAHTYGATVIAAVVPVTVLAAIAIMIHPYISLVLVPWMLLTVSVPFWFKKIADKDGKIIRENLAGMNAEVVDGIQGVREILSFGYESWYLKKIVSANKALASIQVKYGKRLGIESGLLNSCMTLGLLSVTGISIYLISTGKIGVEWYAVSIILSIYVFTPVIAIGNMARSFGIMQSSTDRVFTVLETPATVKDLVETSEGISDNVIISFEHVDFRYKDGSPLVLDDVSFQVLPGETAALVGHSGAGKSTCANLLLRFWDVAGGCIRLGNTDIRKLTQSDLRNYIAVVPQDVYLFNCPIIDNIKLGKPDATEEEVIRAAINAGIHDFITSLPERYDTVVGERGVQLSGGQRQRIAIARALLKNSPVLLMDEAVSNLDTKNEEELRHAINNLRKNRTTLVIAHRLSTILMADKIAVLEGGKIMQVGKHEDLIRQNGVYSKLISSQYMKNYAMDD
jgi:ATP-binding cassette, subfamily C, bacterial CydC